MGKQKMIIGVINESASQRVLETQFTLSLNYKGIDSGSKRLDITRLINIHSPQILFLQETMM